MYEVLISALENAGIDTEMLEPCIQVVKFAHMHTEEDGSNVHSVYWVLMYNTHDRNYIIKKIYLNLKNLEAEFEMPVYYKGTELEMLNLFKSL